MTLAVITGASGLLGANLAIELLTRGHRVRATKRGSSQIRHLDQFAIEWCDADLGDVEALARAFRGADVVFHCAALVSVRKNPSKELVAANVDGTRHVIEAVKRENVPRLVHCSTVGAIGLSENGEPCTETARWNFDERGLADGYTITKHQSQNIVLKAAAEGLDAVIANPTYMFGPYDARPSSGRLIVEIVNGRVPASTDGMNNFVDVRDVARGLIRVWEKGRTGEKYILGGYNMSYRQVAEMIARVAHVDPPRLPAPRIFAYAAGLAGDVYRWMTDREPLINSITARYAFCKDFIFSSEKATRELGYVISPLEPAIQDAIAWLREQHKL